MASPTPFGAPMKAHFPLDPNYNNLNHGSFGTYPSQVLEKQQSLQKSLESSPDIFIRYIQPGLIDTSRAALAPLLNVPVSDLVLVKNATTGVNTVLHNLALTRTLTADDVIVYFDTVYGAVERALFALKESWGVKLRKVKYVFPLEEGEMVKRFREVLNSVRKEGLTPKLAVFETVVSNPGIRFPFEELTRACKEEGVLSLIDGAHAVGMIKLDLAALEVDFFTSNCHKWLYTPRSCAVLYVPERNQKFIRTSLPTSWGYVPRQIPHSESGEDEDIPPSTLPNTGKSPFVALFEFTGTTDDSAYACVPAALNFRNEVCGGEERIYAYLERLAGEAGEVLASALGTDVLRAVKGASDAGKGGKGLGCSMVNVRLPIRITNLDLNSGKKDKVINVRPEEVSPLAHWLHEQLIARSTFVPCFPHGEWMFVRLSAQVYLERSDFVWLGDVLKDIMEGVTGFLERNKNGTQAKAKI
ncbi:pyridoxal phosphate-dependent transferase [Aspergillus nidulans var. acristatus]